MLNIKELEEMGKKAGFSYVALLKSDSIQLMPEVREMCKNNTCHMYAKRWSCPPGVEFAWSDVFHLDNLNFRQQRSLKHHETPAVGFVDFSDFKQIYVLT